ncbi:MAG: PLP-dependent aminotransferase family protein [Kofleriaceae bacterium]|nr:PLP-dependent aminotransferase family protein [Kofleriaceae bacterium]
MVPVSLSFIRLSDASRPLTVQLVRQIREAVLEGHLSAGEPIPSTRELAQQLGVARNTVSAAYQALSSEGTIVLRARRRPFIAALPEQRTAVSSSPVVAGALSQAARRLAMAVPEERLSELMTRRARSRPFGPGIPDLGLLPMRQLERCLVRRWRAMTSADALHDDPRGEISLRRAILRHVAPARGIRATVEQVFITEGSQSGIDLCCRALLDAKHMTWTEAPGSVALRAAVGMTGAKLLSIPVDPDGVRVDVAIRRAAGARVAFVSPAYAFPSGVQLSLARRLQLLDWAVTNGATVVEVDYEGELRADGAPAPALLALDRVGARECVIHIGTFSRSLFPALRLGFAIVPAALVRPFARVRAASTRSAPYPLQAALADFIEDGHWARHMRRLKQATRRRRDLVIAELRRLLPKETPPSVPAGGALFTVHLPPFVDDRALATALAERGVDVLPLSLGARRRAPTRGLILGVGAHTDAALLHAAGVLSHAVREAVSAGMQPARGVRRARSRH